MARIHNLGFPRMGAERQLKFALEKHWRGELTADALEALGTELRQRSLRQQAGLDWVPVGDFSFYDHVLDMSFLLGNVPARARREEGAALDAYFRAARGRAARDTGPGVAAAEMTKWFDTNYHYIVPELSAQSAFELEPSRLLAQLRQARATGVAAKPVILGPVTYLWLGKAKDGSDRLSLLPKLIPAYRELLARLAREGADWVQVDEPALVVELSPAWQEAYVRAYEGMKGAGSKLLLATYFGRLESHVELVASLPVDGVHVDSLNAPGEAQRLLELMPEGRVLSLGVISGRNVWRADLDRVLDYVEPFERQLGDRLWLAPSCSLLHVPLDVANEHELDPELRSWLAFAQQKLDELRILRVALSQGRGAAAKELCESARAVASRRSSTRVHDRRVREAVSQLDPNWAQRRSAYPARATAQARLLKLPTLPTTTIGSFPQTAHIRKARSDFRAGRLARDDYDREMRGEIERTVREQEQLGLDVLVHGEAERSDMVEYFGEMLSGFAFSEQGWVQSYGSRCVKPPILFGDISRPEPMTVEWTRYAQSLTSKPMKGMLTGPVTILNWSFVRDDQPRSASCYQLALAIREEVLDLERAGTRIIQIDEAALREGLPLRRAEWGEYLAWAVETFRIAAGGVADETQIHTHMCYSELHDIIEAVAAMDADVVTLETSRSDMDLLRAFDAFEYPNEIGPGVYDIHSPNVPSEVEIAALMKKAAQKIPPHRLWVNPDCGLKTRSWDEVRPALRNMVSAARRLRVELFGNPHPV